MQLDIYITVSLYTQYEILTLRSLQVAAYDLGLNCFTLKNTKPHPAARSMTHVNLQTQM